MSKETPKDMELRHWIFGRLSLSDLQAFATRLEAVITEAHAQGRREGRAEALDAAGYWENTPGLWMHEREEDGIDVRKLGARLTHNTRIAARR